MLRRIPRPLALVLAVAALLVLAWTFTTTPFQGPDEPEHFEYAQQLAETGHRPTVVEGTRPDSTQVLNSLSLLNLDQLAGVETARPAWSPLEEQWFEEVITELGEPAEEDGTGPNPLAKNPPLYYAYQAVPYHLGSAGSFWDRLIVMRLASGLLFLLTVLFAWLAAAEVFAAMWPRTIAAGVVALLPGLTAMGGLINADNMLIAVWAAFTFAALRTVRRGPTAWRVLGLCALAAASLLAHGRGIAIVPALVAVLLVSVVRARLSLGRIVRVLAPGVALVLLAFSAYQLLLTPGTGAYGGEVNIPTGAFTLGGLLNTTWHFYLPHLPFMSPRLGPDYGYRQVFIDSFFGRFASQEVAYPTVVYRLIQTACAIGIAGLAVAVSGRWAAVRRRWREIAALVAIAVSMLGLLHTASYRALLGGADPLITGRYLLPLVVVFGLTVAFVITSLRPRASAALGALVLSALLALNITGLILTLARFYG
jgi:4-amino-4-deoxy-L-arabinose transferase-like glycosyltransferase